MAITNSELQQPLSPQESLSSHSTLLSSSAPELLEDDDTRPVILSGASSHEGASSSTASGQAQQDSVTLQRFINHEDAASHARVHGLRARTEQPGFTINNLNDIEAVLMILDVPGAMTRSTATYTAGVLSGTLASVYYVECGCHLGGATFEHWLDHILDKHLAHEVQGGITCPLCPEGHLLGDAHNSGDGGVRAAMRQRLIHLGVHYPWLSGRCTWPLLVQDLRS